MTSQLMPGYLLLAYHLLSSSHQLGQYQIQCYAVLSVFHQRYDTHKKNNMIFYRYFELNVLFQLRTLGLAIVTFFLSLTAFISVKTFPILMSIVGLHVCLLIYGCGCSMGAAFMLFVLKETRGLSIDNVEIKAKTNIDINLVSKTIQPLISEKKS